MTTYLTYRLLIGAALLILVPAVSLFAAEAEDDDSTELKTYSVGRINRPSIDLPKIEIERPTIDISRDLALEPVNSSPAVGSLELPPLSLPSLGTQMVTPESGEDHLPPDNSVGEGPQSSAAQNSALERDIRPLKIGAPVFPRDAALAGATGYVVVEFTVTPEGKTTGITIVDAEPRNMFERSARNAVVRWTFEPAMAGGQPVPRRVQQRLNFDLN